MTLPILLSVPHAGLCVPPEATGFCILSPEEIAHDGDEGAAEVYNLADYVQAFVTTDVARAFVDMNRARDDVRKDGVVKTHTCWDVPIYEPPLPDDVIARMLQRYYHPYHQQLTAHAGQARFGIDCHTMAATAPPIALQPGQERPRICISNNDGTFPEEWMQHLQTCLAEAFACEVSVNDPFQGGYIIRRHASEMPWVQLELSRAPFLTNAQKRQRIITALEAFCGITG